MLSLKGYNTAMPVQRHDDLQCYYGLINGNKNRVIDSTFILQTHKLSTL